MLMNHYLIKSSLVLSSAVIATLISGCAIGYDSTMMVTKTNAGLDFSAAPPTAAISMDRSEGVVTPQFQDGQVLPAMASFKGSANGLFSPAAGSTFATGDAAVGMSALFADSTPGDASTRIASIQGDNPTYDSSRKLKYKPTIPGLFFGLFKTDFQKKEVDSTVKVRPVFFATQTSLGLKVAWSGLTATVPDSVTAGYNRKELGVLPISMTEIPENGATPATYKMKQASLLATLDADSDIKGASSSNLQSVQFFAVGDAASLLSQQQYVREAMFESMGGAAGDALVKSTQADQQRSGQVGDIRSSITANVDGITTQDMINKVWSGLETHKVWEFATGEVAGFQQETLVESKASLMKLVKAEESLEVLEKANAVIVLTINQ